MRHDLPIVLVGMLLCPAGCGSEPARMTERAPPPDADERRLVREFNALLRGPDSHDRVRARLDEACG